MHFVVGFIFVYSLRETERERDKEILGARRECGSDWDSFGTCFRLTMFGINACLNMHSLCVCAAAPVRRLTAAA